MRDVLSNHRGPTNRQRYLTMPLFTIIVFLVAWGYFSDRILRYLQRNKKTRYRRPDIFTAPCDGIYSIGWTDGKPTLVTMKKGERFPIPPR